METDSSHRVIMGVYVVTPLAPSFLIGSSSFLQVIRTTIKSRRSSKFGQIGPQNAELDATERLEKFPQTYNGRNVVTTKVHTVLMDLLLVGNDVKYKSLHELEFRQIPSLTTELPLSILKNYV